MSHPADLLQYRDRRPKALMPPVVNGRVPPHDLDAEAAVLSACLLSRFALDQVLDLLQQGHFYSDANGWIWEAMIRLAGAGAPVDIVAVASWLRDRERLAQIGGPSYLAQLADATPAVAHVLAHAQIVYEKWRVRALIATCQRIAAEGYGDVGSAQEFIDIAERDIYELARTARRETGMSIGEAAAIAYQTAAQTADKGLHVAGTPTGFEKLDAKTSGMHGGELWIIAGRPGMGKSSAAFNIGVNVAAPRVMRFPDASEGGFSDTAVQAFSLEMPKEQVGLRAICSEGRVDVGKVRQGYVQPDDWRRLSEAQSFLNSIPMWVDDKSALTLLELRATVRRRKAEFDREATATTPARKLRVVIVDYLQLMRGSGRPGQNREQEISELSRGLKELAKELDVTMIALSQLSRDVEKRGKGARPQISDLRESGAIEQDADTIIFIYRDELYNPETTNAKGIAEWIVAKQRNGSTGKVLVRFTQSCTRFDNLAAGDYPDLEAVE